MTTIDGTIKKLLMKEIDKPLNEFYKKYVINKKKEVKRVYGGITERDILIRGNEHIEEGKWKIGEVKEIEISEKKLSLNEWKTLIKLLENRLITQLDKKFSEKCVNARENSGKIIQTGGRGVKINNGDKIKFYVMYELK